MVRGATLAHVVRERSGERPEETAFLHVRDGDADERPLSVASLDRRARAVAAALERAGNGDVSGERALLLLPHGLAFPCALLGCFYASVVAVPTNPPGPRRPLERTAAIARDAEVAFVLTTRAIAARREAIVTEAPELARAAWILVEDVADDPETGSSRDGRLPAPDQLAFLQYTSGSTGSPKGVMVSHANVLHNVECLRQSLLVRPSSVMVSWLPYHHDMGLVGMLLTSLYVGAQCVVLSPTHFLERPIRWLLAVTRHRGTVTGAPDFAYDLCVRRAELDPALLEELDLSTIDRCFSGSEPIRARTLERFARVFAPTGMRSEAFVPGYGLAEATLAVSGSTVHGAPRVVSCDRRALEDGILRPALDEAGRRLVGCGPPLPGFEVAIVDPLRHTRRVDGAVGEIWIRGESVAQGYWRKPAATREIFGARLAAEEDAGPWLRTGDLGLLDGGEVHVTGRLKDLVILQGQNHYPQDLERCAEGAHPALRPGGAAAFAEVRDDGPEHLALVLEVRRPRGFDADEVFAAVRSRLASEEGVEVEHLTLIAPGRLPRTTSGKVRRRETRTRLADGGLAPLARWSRPAETPRARPAGHTEDALVTWLAARVAHRTGLTPEAVDRDASLAALGLDSLGATELLHALADELGAAPPLARLFEGAGLRALAIEALEVRAALSPVAAPTDPPFDPNACSAGQRSMWFLHALAPASAAYNLAVALAVRSALTPDALERALEELVRRHAVLRTTFHPDENGEPRRHVHAALPIDTARVETGSLSVEAVLARATEDARRPFDLAHGPLLRLRWYARSDGPDVCLLATHHIALDHWSLATLLHELAALLANEELALPASSWDDWLRFEQALPRTRSWRDSLAYWTAKLADAPEPLPWPASFARRPEEPAAGAHVRRRLAVSLTTRLAALARERDTTPFLVTLTVFEACLHRLTGREDFLLATLSAGREEPRFASLVGYLVNPVVLRADLRGAPSFEQLFERVRGDAAQAFAHASLPFPQLVQELRPERDASGTPFVQTLFAWQNAHAAGGSDLTALALGMEGAGLELGSLRLETLPLELGTTQFDLSLNAGLVDGELVLDLEYDTRLFERSGAERLLGDYVRLLEQFLDKPSCRVRSANLLDAAERERIRAFGTGPPVPVEAERSVIHGIAEVCRQHPDRTALACGPLRWTYGELGARVAAVDANLRARGVGPGRLVGLELARSPELVIAMLAVASTGAAWTPIDPALPAARRARLRDEADLVLDGDAVARLADGTTDAELSPKDVAASFPAYVMHTSGSTGEPKAVPISHGALATHAWAAVHHFGLSSSDSVLHMASIGFDLCIEEIFPTLLAGARLVVRNVPAPPSVAELEHLVDELGVSVLDLPTVYWHEWMRVAIEERRTIPTALRLVIVGGERASSAAWMTWRALGPDVRCVNTYGPTEATVTTTLFDPTHEDAPEGPVPIGRPVAGQRVVVLDPTGLPVAPGVVGELAIGGPCLAQGYAALPRKTAESFVPDPLFEGARLYLTGDMVRFDETGRLHYVGRRDDQVKVRGFRIEPGEVEAQLLEHPVIAEACVLGYDAGQGRTRLAAWVVCGTERPQPTALFAWLSERLPEAFVPSTLVAIDAIPRNARGKVDRAALRASLDGLEVAGTTSASGQPQTTAERTLAAVWSELLGLEGVGRHDDFFALGGDSIQSIQAASRAAREGLSFTPAELFAHPTLEGLARIARRADAEVAAEPAASGPVPLTPIQRWFLEQDLAHVSHWNMSLGFDVVEPRAPERWREALQELAYRHDALRLRFTQRNGAWTARVLDRAQALVPFDVLSTGEDEEALVASLQEQLDLEHGPVFAGFLLHHADGAERLLLTAHHLVVDAVSWRLLVDDLERLLVGEDPGPAPTSWTRWARASTEALARLAPDAPSPPDAAPLPREGEGANTVRDEVALLHCLEADATERLRAAASRSHADLEELLLTAVVRSMARWSGRAHVDLEVERHGRDQDAALPDVSGTVGWFTELVHVACDVEPEAPVTAALREVKDALRSAPRERAARFRARHGPDAARRRELAAAPELSFNFLGALPGGPDGAVLRLRPTPPPAQRSPEGRRLHVFEVDAWIAAGRLHVRWSFARGLHEHATIEALLADMDATLAELGSARDLSNALMGSDFPLAGLEGQDLEQVFRQLGNRP